MLLAVVAAILTTSFPRISAVESMAPLNPVSRADHPLTIFSCYG